MHSQEIAVRFHRPPPRLAMMQQFIHGWPPHFTLLRADRSRVIHDAMSGIPVKMAWTEIDHGVIRHLLFELPEEQEIARPSGAQVPTDEMRIEAAQGLRVCELSEGGGIFGSEGPA